MARTVKDAATPMSAVKYQTSAPPRTATPEQAVVARKERDR
jgi:hypothetical protein